MTDCGLPVRQESLGEERQEAASCRMRAHAHAVMQEDDASVTAYKRREKDALLLLTGRQRAQMVL